MGKVKITSSSFYFDIGTEEQASLKDKEYLPDAIARSKFTRLSKMVLKMHKELGVGSELPVVFGTNYGEISNIVKVLESVKTKKNVRPVEFQNSVHNNPMSFNSVLFGNKNTILTVSKGDDTGWYSLWTAYAILKSNIGLNKIVSIAADTYSHVPDNVFEFPETASRETACGFVLSLSDEPCDLSTEVRKNGFILGGMEFQAASHFVTSCALVASLAHNLNGRTAWLTIP